MPNPNKNIDKLLLAGFAKNEISEIFNDINDQCTSTGFSVDYYVDILIRVKTGESSFGEEVGNFIDKLVQNI